MAFLESYTKEDLSFVEELPKILEIECPICLQVMLRDPHLVTCCGHHFCGTCITKVRSTGSPCPMCNEKNYQSFLDKNTFRIINGLKVYCTNRKVTLGCQWKGELKDLSTHLSRGKRKGECQFEEVKCRNENCTEKVSRCLANGHEKTFCRFRLSQCSRCKTTGTYQFLATKHIDICPNYPVTCPNKCNFPKLVIRSKLNDHLSKECPLQPVECMFSWAGCTDKPLRKDSQSHTTDLKHMSLLAVACGQLKRENDKYKKNNEKLITFCHQLKEDSTKLKQDYEEIKKQNTALSEGYTKLQERIHQAERTQSNRYDTLASTCIKLKEIDEKLFRQLRLIYHPPTTIYPILPVDVKEPEIVHFYTSLVGHLMSIKLETSLYTVKFPPKIQVKVSLAVHNGKFYQFQPKFPMKIEVSVNFCSKSQVVSLIEGNSYERLPFNILSNESGATSLSDCKIVLFNFPTHQSISAPIGTASAKVSAKWN